MTFYIILYIMINIYIITIQVRSEVGFQRQILRVMGSLEGIIHAATMPVVSFSSIAATATTTTTISTSAGLERK